MSCTVPHTCADGCCIPKPLSASNQLGFTGGHSCCKSPCIDFPPHNVQICMKVAAGSSILIQTGCRIPSATDPTLCQLKFTDAPAQTSWGKACRNITWSRYVPTFTYIRIRICQDDNNCGDPCPAPVSGYYSEVGATNALTRFVVDGRDFANAIYDIAAGTVGGINDGEAGYVVDSCVLKAACIGARGTAVPTDGRCCEWYKVGEAEPVVNWAATGAAGLDDLPIGTEIVFGPIGQVFI